MSSEVRTFASSVREYLADLSETEVQELTGGLEADLSEHLADNGQILAEPDAYAAELRIAAGLPPREIFFDDVAPESRQSTFLSRLQTDWISGWETFTETPMIAAFGRFLKTLTPIWWVFRGWAIYALLQMFWLGNSGTKFHALPVAPWHWFGLVLGVLISVMWGQNEWMDKRFFPVVKKIVSLAVVLAIPYLAVMQLPEGEKRIRIRAGNGGITTG